MTTGAMDVDHYAVLGLPSGKEGAKLSEKEISKAYKRRALKLHPDKRAAGDPNAHAGFLQLKSSYEILKDEQLRKVFDDSLRAKHERQRRQPDSKLRRMEADLAERERAAKAERKVHNVEEEEEKQRVKSDGRVEEGVAAWVLANINSLAQTEIVTRGVAWVEDGLEKVLEVPWVKTSVDYTEQMLVKIILSLEKLTWVKTSVDYTEQMLIKIFLSLENSNMLRQLIRMGQSMHL